MDENKSNNTNNTNKNICSCLLNQTFKYILIFIIVVDSISVICNILYLSITHWDFVHKSIFALSITSQCFTVIILGFAITILIFKKYLYKDNIKYLISKIFSLVMLILSPIIFILNLILAIYITIDLHIADYPEYGGRERDEKYIEEHPEKFGDVSDGQYVIGVLCPIIVTISHIVLLFFNLMLFLKIYYLSEEFYNKNLGSSVKVIKTDNKEEVKDKESETKKVDQNLEVIKTDDRLYPNKTNLPENLNYSTKKEPNSNTEGPMIEVSEPEQEEQD